MSRLLIVTGALLIVVGLLWGLLAKIPYLGRMPGDILIQKKNFTFYFPLTTSIIASVVLSLILWLLSRR